MNPKYVAFVGNIESGKVKKGGFLIQQGVRGMRRLTQNHWESIIVDSFSVYIQRDTTIIYKFFNKGNIFEEELNSRFKELKANDRVLVFNIYARDVGNKVVFLQPLEYIIQWT